MYTRDQRRALFRQWYAARKAKRLCRDCRMPVTRFVRCAACRQAIAPHNKALQRMRRARDQEPQAA
jgi:hypothetical protein